MDLEEFRRPTPADIPVLTDTFRDCEWTDEYIENINDQCLRILLVNGTIIGIVCFEFTGHSINGIPLYYILSECTKDKRLGHLVGVRSPGRLLWSHILREIHFDGNEDSGFIVYNHAIPDAKGYHIKMGMKTSSEIQFQGRPLRDRIEPLFIRIPELNTAMLPIEDGVIDELDDTYLFYVSKDINYGDIYTILRSLPQKKREIEHVANNAQVKTKHKAGKNTKHKAGKKRPTKKRNKKLK